MITTGTSAKTLRKNTTCPTGIVSPKPRMSADITANSSSDASLSAIPLATCMDRDARRRRRAAGLLVNRNAAIVIAVPLPVRRPGRFAEGTCAALGGLSWARHDARYEGVIPWTLQGAADLLPSVQR